MIRGATPGGYKPFREADGEHGVCWLTPKDKFIAKELLTGKNNMEIAAVLGMKVRTVKWHCKRIYEFTGVHSRLQYMAKMMAPRNTTEAELEDRHIFISAIN